MDLTNSKRVAYKASYVVTQLTPDEQQRVGHSTGQGLVKANHVRALQLTTEDLERLRQPIAQVQDRAERSRLQRVFQLASQIAAEPGTASPVALAPQAAALEPAAVLAFSKLVEQELRQNGAHVVEPLVAAYQQMQKVSPVGRLHLERLEMYPVGIEQGELVFTVPLAPSETCTISHKEWSTSSSDYESLVDDYFEAYSERGVAEKTDVSMASENEAKHSLALNFGASVSGGFGPVSVSTTFGLNSGSEERESVKRSTQQSREVTEKASARSRQEHKVSVKLEAKHGVDDSSFRTIANSFADRALRVDYYRLMRKWRTDLFRYGVRLTYDMALPNPGARFWARYRDLADLDRQLRVPFAFSLSPSDLTETAAAGGAQPAWLTYAIQHGAVIDPPPSPAVRMTVWKALTNAAGGMEALEFVAPAGYELGSDAIGRGTVSDGDTSHVSFTASLANFQNLPSTVGQGFKVELKSALLGTNRATVFVTYAANLNAMVELEVAAKRTEETMRAWQLRAWSAIRDAALAQYQQQLTVVQNRRDQLFADLTGKDTLTLRRLEREELVRLVMEWIVGPSFYTAPDTISKTVDVILGSESAPAEITIPMPFGPPKTMLAKTDLQVLSNAQWADARQFGEFVKFVQDAVEWENLVYFLYPYFWGSEKLARDKLLFEHPDPTHRDFLRAGYVRVVIPIRPGYEADFTSLVETGTFSGAVSSPYLTIAEEVEAFAKTNYGGIPPANPERHARPLLYPQQRTTWATMETVVTALEQYRVAHGAYPPDLATLGGGPYKDAWGRALVYMIPGSGNDYDLFSYGADGEPGGDDLDADISAAAPASLIASWFDYTPTSGLDIELTAKPALVV